MIVAPYTALDLCKGLTTDINFALASNRNGVRQKSRHSAASLLREGELFVRVHLVMAELLCSLCRSAMIEAQCN
jgi:hypothetical protein